MKLLELLGRILKAVLFVAFAVLANGPGEPTVVLTPEWARPMTGRTARGVVMLLLIASAASIAFGLLFGAPAMYILAGFCLPLAALMAWGLRMRGR